MTEREVYMALFDISINTYYLWKRQRRPVFILLEKYFSKEDLEEFIFSKKISRFDTQGNKIYKDHIRTSEIIMLLTKRKPKMLASTLAESLELHNVISSTSKRLKNITTGYAFLGELEKILRDLSYDTDNNFHKIIDDFNKKIGFDFSEDDSWIVLQILSRYNVYSTLYDLENQNH